MSNKIGEQSWNMGQSSNGSDSVGKDSFLRLSQGSNLIRLLTLPHAYFQHKIESKGSSQKWGWRINCAAGENGENCPACALPNKAKRKWLIGVIDRKTNQYRILDIGYSVFSNIKTYASDADWGDPTTFDIDLIVNAKGSPMDYYRSAPKPKKPLSEDDLQIKAEHPTDELVKRCQPWTVERVQAMLDKIKEESDSHFESELVLKGTGVSSEIEDPAEDFFTNYDTVKGKK